MGSAVGRASGSGPRLYVVESAKALTDNTATSLFEIALPTLAMTGGQIQYTVRCTDGTDMQALSGDLSFAAVNKGGVYTTTVSTDTQSVALSAGTLTATMSIVTGTNKITLKLTADTSLTATTFNVTYCFINNSPQAVTLL